MKKRPPETAAGDLGLPEEPLLGPDEAAEAVREARRISGRPAPPVPEPPQDDADGGAEPLIPWGPMSPDEIPS